MAFLFLRCAEQENGSLTDFAGRYFLQTFLRRAGMVVTAQYGSIPTGRPGGGGKAVGPNGETHSPKAYVRPYGVWCNVQITAGRETRPLL